jgi:hypothetical protein
VEPNEIFPVFGEILRWLEDSEQLSRFQAVEQNLLIALDGTEYFCSDNIHCAHCSSRTFKNGKTQYFHAVVTPVIVAPDNSQVIPLVPEFIVPQDGYNKQDCENAAAKRWLEKYAQQYARFGITILGDDLYAHQPLWGATRKSYAKKRGILLRV